MRQRRVVVGLSLVASTEMGMLASYQMRLVSHIPEPLLPLLDADRMEAVPEAYTMRSTPHAVIGLVSYASTMVLAVKVAADTVMAATSTADQWTKHRVFWSWCLLGFAAAFASVP